MPVGNEGLDWRNGVRAISSHIFLAPGLPTDRSIVRISWTGKAVPLIDNET
jgi:hypothetical protein